MKIIFKSESGKETTYGKVMQAGLEAFGAEVPKLTIRVRDKAATVPEIQELFTGDDMISSIEVTTDDGPITYEGYSYVDIVSEVLTDEFREVFIKLRKESNQEYPYPLPVEDETEKVGEGEEAVEEEKSDDSDK